MLIEKGKITRGYLGLVPEDLKKYEKTAMKVESGAIVRSVQNDGPAAVAGIKEKDVIVRVGNMPIRDQQDVRNAMLVNAPGTTIKVELIRNGERKTLDVKVKEFPKELVANTMPSNPKSQDTPFEFFDHGKDFGFGPEELDKLRERMEKGSPKPETNRQGRVRLGVGVEKVTPELQKQFSIPGGEAGVVIKNIEEGSVAEKLGLKIGDVIQEFDGKPITDPESLIKALEGVKWGESRSIKVTRFGENSRSTIQRTVTFE